MLRHNYHWDRTGGVRLSLDAPEGGVVQIVDLATAGLDVPQLADAVGTFAEAARAGREIIRRPQTSGDLATDDASIPLIRV